jgi:hypothetical protein
MEAFYIIIVIVSLIVIVIAINAIANKNKTQENEIQEDETKESGTLKSEIYEIGEYRIAQIINDIHTDCITIVEYDKTSDQIVIQIDGRKTDFRLIPNKEQILKFRELLEKSIDWKGKAFEAKISGDKEVGTFESKISLEFAGKKYYVNNGLISIKFTCRFTDYYEEYYDGINEEYYSNILISTPNIDIAEAGIQIPAAIVFLNISEINNLLNLISMKTIDKVIAEHNKNTELIDDILN